ncbi:TetR/AcrR family transcriptional regulator [Brachybacterium sp. DNPG3]
MSAREDLLDALERLLIHDGERAATLDAVAAAAGVSKGGLLYHFGSKKALMEGLAERARERGRADVAAMAAAEEGPSLYYVRTSVYEDSPFDRTLVAISRLSRTYDSSARAVFDEIQGQWLAQIREEVGDDAVAQAIMLIGDGLYFNAMLDPEAPSGVGRSDGALEALLGVVARLRDGA